MLLQLVQRAPARSLSLEASGPHKMTGTAQASGAIRRRRRDRVQVRPQARLRRHRIETAWLAIPLWALSALGKGQKPQGARRHARGGGGLATAVVTEISSLPGAVLVRVFSTSCRRARFLKLRRAR
jgi:hypothetical protein